MLRYEGKGLDDMGYVWYEWLIGGAVLVIGVLRILGVL